MDGKYVVYTEDLSGEKVERYYFGCYGENDANNVAERLGNDFPIFHCVCKADEAKEFGIKNLPNYLQ